jgi:hypothetical protein
MGMTFRSATASELQRSGAIDLSGRARVWRTATSLLGRVVDGLVRFSEPYYADAARAGLLLQRMPPERRMEAALEWHSRIRRIV